jgi:hypothetical protein
VVARETLKSAFYEVREGMTEQSLAELCAVTGAPRRVPPGIEAKRALIERIGALLPAKAPKLKLVSGSGLGGAGKGAGAGAVSRGGAGAMDDNDDGRVGGKRSGGGGMGGPAKKTKLAGGWAGAGVGGLGGVEGLGGDRSKAGGGLKGPPKAGGSTPAAPATPAEPLYPPHAAYPGFKLGPWTPPSSLSLHPSLAAHAEEGSVEPEEPLWLSRALGLRAFLPATARDAALARRRMEPVATLPSGNTVFPNNEGYTNPAAPPARGATGGVDTMHTDVYYADLATTRRYYNMTVSSHRWAGGLAWEEGWATGLSAGLGSGLRWDGSAWETQALGLEATFLPLDEQEEVEGGLEGLSFEDEEEAGGGSLEAAREGTGTGAGDVPPVAAPKPLSKDEARLATARASVTRAAAEVARLKGLKDPRPSLSSLNAAELALRAARDTEVLETVRSLAYARARAAARRAAELAALTGTAAAAERGGREEGDDTGEGGLTYRPRLGRGARILIDRLRLPAVSARPEIGALLADGLATLAKRNTLIASQRTALLSQWGLAATAGPEGGGLDGRAALGLAAPAALSMAVVYKALLDSGGAGSAFGRGDASSVGAGSEGEGPFARSARRTGVTTAFVHAPLQAPAVEGPRPSVPSWAGAPQAPSDSLSPFGSLFSPSTDALLGGGGEGRVEGGSSDVAQLRAGVLRMAAGADPTGAAPAGAAVGGVGRRRPGAAAEMMRASAAAAQGWGAIAAARATMLVLPDARFADLWMEGDSDSEDTLALCRRAGGASSGPAGAHSLAAEGQLRAAMEAVPLSAA